MKILITGATGFIGRHLTDALVKSRHSLVALSRNPNRARQVLPESCEVYSWRPELELPPQDALLNCQAVIHLAGESIQGRWTRAKKAEIHDSRIVATRNLMRGLQTSPNPPRVIISASAIGYYGSRGDEILTEKSPPGNSFLAHVCEEWEAEVNLPGIPGLRRVLMRTALVLGRDGGAFPWLIRPFRMGLGGMLGDGSQWMSWIHTLH